MRKFKFSLADGSKIYLNPPALRDYDIIRKSGDSAEIIGAVFRCFGEKYEYIVQKFTVKDLCTFIEDLIAWVLSEREKDRNLQTPYVPEESEFKPYLLNKSGDLKIVSDYTGLNFNEVYQLEIFDFWQYLHDAVVWNCSRTAEGKDYLERAYLLKKKEPDRNVRLKGVRLRHGRH